METPYFLAPLSHDTSAPRFRLLMLHPSTQVSLIECSLLSYSFDESCPAYKALSYNWGRIRNTHQIRLNGYGFPISRNLWAFLEQMRIQRQWGFYWIDAICIDQSNTLEKNHQVQMMRRIYSTATSVMIWLGEASEDNTSDMAMDAVASAYTWVSNRRSGNSMHESHFIRDERTMNALEHLFSRDYWTRIWIIQETMVAKDISVHCGSKELHWTLLVRFMVFVATIYEKDPEHVVHLYATPAMRLVFDWQKIRETQRWSPIAELIVYYASSKASNILDKVYALCGLASDGGDITIEYGISPEVLIAHLLDRAPKSSSAEDLRSLAFNAYESLELNPTLFSMDELLIILEIEGHKRKIG
ncbi:hypothetical protein COCCADRAFT_86476 [Bipolaris zeicola 26-R-13]|uniref:Heterokaryon incompatibility domain-containing protein n=1 Tax=Cochliobolus carbonum (strain 26-R-13) TaxID=930089 RepID=W6Z0B1_COCC2|nr:uncharacterized protein COCCADRAFT_86476 [Bipolaris zeicola 26-R-13]EUC37136.1 hypothetical protein COCCADRAFT_86476 [Bipolaris zeicola 26-R-13]